MINEAIPDTPEARAERMNKWVNTGSGLLLEAYPPPHICHTPIFADLGVGSRWKCGCGRIYRMTEASAGANTWVEEASR